MKRGVRANSFAQKGFTLVEMIMVIVITGILAGIVAVFIQRPLEGYFDSSRRAQLSDAADLALRRMGRELRHALPNSVRVSSNGRAIEFLPTLAAGRYAENSVAGCFAGAGCTGLTTLGSLGAAANAYAGQFLVIFNYYNNAAGDCVATTLPSAYCSHNLAVITASATSAGQDTFTLAATRFHPSGGSPNHRFQIVDAPVSFVCDPSAGALIRYTGYGLQVTQPATFSGASSALLVDGVSACQFGYQAGVRERMGIASARLTLTREGEGVSLYQEWHVSDAP
jgi:MSHA biogenesis protein MshO